MDIKFSLKGKAIKRFREAIDLSYKLLCKETFYRHKSEEKNKIFRRSIFAAKDIKKNEKFTKVNIRRIRPGYGLSPIYYEKLLGKKSPLNLYRGEPINRRLLGKLKIQ